MDDYEEINDIDRWDVQWGMMLWRGAYNAWVTDNIDMFINVKSMLYVCGIETATIAFELFLQNVTPDLQQYNVTPDEFVSRMNEIYTAVFRQQYKKFDKKKYS